MHALAAHYEHVHGVILSPRSRAGYVPLPVVNLYNGYNSTPSSPRSAYSVEPMTPVDPPAQAFHYATNNVHYYPEKQTPEAVSHEHQYSAASTWSQSQPPVEQNKSWYNAIVV